MRSVTSQPGRAGRCTGFTLLELLLVLAILTTVLAISFPALQQMQSRAHFKATVINFQSELYQTRLAAMKNGTALVVCFRSGSGSYEIMPKEVYDRRMAHLKISETMVGSLESGEDESMSESESMADNSFNTGFESQPGRIISSTDNTRIEKRQLPPEMIFQSDEASQTIVFYPNGRTSQAFFTLVSTGEDNWYGEIAIRGITGVPRINRIGVRTLVSENEEDAREEMP